MDLKVYMNGVQRTVSGVDRNTTCQDIMLSLTQQPDRYVLVEKWRSYERQLNPQEYPIKSLNRWGEYAKDVDFIVKKCEPKSVDTILTSKSALLSSECLRVKRQETTQPRLIKETPNALGKKPSPVRIDQLTFTRPSKSDRKSEPKEYALSTTCGNKEMSPARNSDRATLHDYYDYIHELQKTRSKPSSHSEELTSIDYNSTVNRSKYSSPPSDEEEDYAANVSSSMASSASDHDSYSLDTTGSSWQNELSLNLSSSDSIDSDLTFTNERNKNDGNKQLTSASVKDSITRSSESHTIQQRPTITIHPAKVMDSSHRLDYEAVRKESLGAVESTVKSLNLHNLSKAKEIEANIKDIDSILREKKRIVADIKRQTRDDDSLDGSDAHSDEEEGEKSDKRKLRAKLTDIENQIEICRQNLEQLLDEIHHSNVLKEAEIKMKEEEVNIKKQTLLSSRNCVRCSLFKEEASNNKTHKNLLNADAQLNNRNQHNQENQRTPRSQKQVEKPKPVCWTVPVSRSKSSQPTEIGLRTNSQTASTGKEPTLRQAFESKRPHLLQRIDRRAGKINAKSEIRRRTVDIRRQRAIHEYTLTKQMEEEERRLKAVIRFVEPRKILSEKEMRSQTARRYCSLPEIESRKEQQKKEEESRKHRMISRIFSQKLKYQALRGQVSLPFTEKVSC